MNNIAVPNEKLPLTDVLLPSHHIEIFLLKRIPPINNAL